MGYPSDDELKKRYEKLDNNKDLNEVCNCGQNNTNKVLVHIPMHVLDVMVKDYKMTVDEAINNTVNTVREEIKLNYENWKKENK